MKVNISAAQVILDFKRRKIECDFTYDISFGKLKVWRINNLLIGELCTHNDLLITSKCAYINTIQPQDMANDIINELNLKASDSLYLESFGNGKLTTTQIESLYNLPTGSVRRDIHRGKIKNAEKIGRDWVVSEAEINEFYKEK